MAINVSASGTIITIIASNSAPFVPIIISEWSNEANPISFNDHQGGGGIMDLNGFGIRWSKALPIRCNLSVINGSNSDIKLALLYMLNRVGGGKRSAADRITMTISGPNQLPILCTGGWVLSGAPSPSASAQGNFRGKNYSFEFDNLVGLPISPRGVAQAFTI